MSSTTPSTAEMVMIPGLNAPLNWKPTGKSSPEDQKAGPKKLFPSALNYDSEDYSMPLATLREIDMLQLMDHVTDKPSWETKVFDENIVSKWKEEALSWNEYDFTQPMLKWVIEELKYRANIFRATGAVIVYNGDVVKSDTAIPDILKESLRAAVKALEDIPEVHVDYHPGSNGMVIDLVHPSLFPLIYGRSRVLEDRVLGLENCIQMIGKGKTVEIPPEDQIRNIENRFGSSYWGHRNSKPEYSRNFQWLPCEVKFSAEDESVNYINNLHPQKHKELYGVIEQIISRAIPLWNMTLTPQINHNFRYKRIEYTSVEYLPYPESTPEEERIRQKEDEDDDDFADREEEWERNYRQNNLVPPEPGEFMPPQEAILPTLFPTTKEDVKGVNLRDQYSSKGLQVIVKLANILLTPEKPSYEGGSWHVEGHMNEHICATALYYYDSENITESSLAFRQQGDQETVNDIDYDQGDHDWAKKIFGVSSDMSTVQDVGDVICKEGRLLTFPNILQHRVTPFKLDDPSKPGHRKIVALFLVDPNITIISTAHVPPQQRDWWSEEIIASGSLDRLPRELQNQLIQEVDDFPIGLDEAKEIREKLMSERKKFEIQQNKGFEAASFSLCEH